MSAYMVAALRAWKLRGRSFAGLMVITAVVAAGCGVAASPSPSPVPSASPSPVPSPSPSVDPSAASSAGPNPAAAIKIAPPYTTSAIDPFMENSMRELFLTGAGSFGSLLDFGGVQVNRDDKLAGFLFTLSLPNDVPFDATSWEAFRKGMEGGSATTFTSKTINGTDVYFGTASGTPIAVMLLDGDVVFIIGLEPGTETEEIATAVASANA